MNAEDFRKQLTNAKHFQSFIFDEASLGLSARSAMSKVNKMIVNSLQIIGQKNLFIFIVLPSFFDLDKYVAIDRSLFLLHTYTQASEKGMFRAYNNHKKKNLYLFGKVARNMNKEKASFFGKFPKTYTVDEEAYRKKKMEYLDKNWEEMVNPVKKTKRRNSYEERTRNRLLSAIYNLTNQGYKQKEIAKILSSKGKRLSITTVGELLAEARKKFDEKPSDPNKSI